MEVAENKKVLVPKLRFGEFDESWTSKRLSDVSKIITGSTPPTSNLEFYDGNRLFVSPADMGGTRIVLRTKTTLTDLGFSKGRKIKQGAVLFVSIGSTIGKVAIAGKECITNQQINSLEANCNNCDDFIFEVLQKQGHFIKSLAGVQAVPLLNKTDFSGLKFNFPTLPEQQKIASFLSAVDEKIQLLNRKKELLEDYKKGIMQKLFPKKAGQAPELRFKRPNGDNFPDWEEKKLGEVGMIVSGLTYSPNDISEEGVLVLRSSNVKEGNLDFSDQVLVNVGNNFNPVQEGDVLICVRNGSTRLIGKAAVITKEAEGLAFGAFMTVYRSKYNNYLSHYFTSKAYYKNVHRNLGATINSINGSDLKKFKVHFPVVEEQKLIADFIYSIDQNINQVATQINQTQTFKKGLLQQMFV